MPTTYGWSDDDIERRALTLAALIRRAWRLVAEKITGKKNQPIAYADLGQLPRLWSQQVDTALLGFIGATVLDGAESVNALPDFPTGFEIGEDLVESHLQTAQGRLWDVGVDVWQSVQAQLIAGHKANETYEQVAARIKHATGVSDKKSLTIARTEIHAALEAGQYLQALMVDPNGKKTWLATEDDRTRLSHREADGQVQLIGDSFTVGGSALAFPGDPSGPPEEIINCRCSVAYDFDFADAPQMTPDAAMVAAGKWTPEEAAHHPRDVHGKFIEKGSVLFNALSAVDTFDFLSSVMDIKHSDWTSLKDDQKNQIINRLNGGISSEYHGYGAYKGAKANLDALVKLSPPKSEPAVSISKGIQPPDTSPGLAKAVPGDVYKKQPAGAIIAVTGDGKQRLRYGGVSNKYSHEVQTPEGQWKSSALLTKKAAYEKLKANQHDWRKPKTPTGQTVQKVQTTGPSEPHQAPNAGVPSTTAAPNTKLAPLPKVTGIPEGIMVPSLPGEPLVPATIYKPHADGELVAVFGHGAFSMHYDKHTNKYEIKRLKADGTWGGGGLITKKNAYEQVKEGKWFKPTPNTTSETTYHGATPNTAPTMITPAVTTPLGDHKNIPPQALKTLTLKKPESLTLKGKAKTGDSKAKIYLDQDGNRWLVKSTGSETLPTLEVATAELQRKMGLLGPSSFAMDVDGKHSFVQAMFDGKNAFKPGEFDPTKLTHQQIVDMQKEQVLDWLIGNNDSHSGQFLELPNGQLTSIDKGHAFRFYALDELKPMYAPWSPNSGNKITYPEMWHQYETGENILMNDPDQGEIAQVIKQTMDIPDNEIRDLFRPYAQLAAKKGYLSKYNGDPEKFLDAIVTRKNNLRHDFVKLFEETTQHRNEKISGGKPTAKSITSDDTQTGTPYDKLPAAKKLKLLSQSDWLALSDAEKTDFVAQMNAEHENTWILEDWDPKFFGVKKSAAGSMNEDDWVEAAHNGPFFEPGTELAATPDGKHFVTFSDYPNLDENANDTGMLDLWMATGGDPQKLGSVKLSEEGIQAQVNQITKNIYGKTFDWEAVYKKAPETQDVGGNGTTTSAPSVFQNHLKVKALLSKPAPHPGNVYADEIHTWGLVDKDQHDHGDFVAETPNGEQKLIWDGDTKQYVRLAWGGTDGWVPQDTYGHGTLNLYNPSTAYPVWVYTTAAQQNDHRNRLAGQELIDLVTDPNDKKGNAKALVAVATKYPDVHPDDIIKGANDVQLDKTGHDNWADFVMPAADGKKIAAGEFTPNLMYDPNTGVPNWFAMGQALKNGQLLHNVVVARTKDEKLRIRTHSTLPQWVTEEDQGGSWIPLEINKPEELGIAISEHAPYEDWVSIYAPAEMQPDNYGQPEFHHVAPPIVGDVTKIAQGEITKAFGDAGLKFGSSNEAIFLKMQEIKKNTLNGDKSLTDAQILKALDDAYGGDLWTKKIFQWAQTPYGADFMKNNFWDPSWKTAEPDDSFASGYPSANDSIDLPHLFSGHNDLHWINLSSAIIHAGPNQVIAVNRVDTKNGPVITRMVTRPNFGKPGDPDQHIIAMERRDNATGKWTTIFADNYSYDFHKLEQRVKVLEEIDGSSGWKNATGAKILPGIVPPSTPSPTLPNAPTPTPKIPAAPKAPAAPKVTPTPTSGHTNPTGDELFALKTSILYTNGSTIASATGPDGTKYKLVASGGSIGAKSASPSDPNTWKTDKWIYNANDANTYISGTGLDWTVQDPPAWTGSTIQPADGSTPIPYVSWQQIKVWAPYAGKTQYNGKTTPIAYDSYGTQRIIFNGPGKNFVKQKWDATDKKWVDVTESPTLAPLGKNPSKWHKKYWFPVDAAKVHVPKSSVPGMPAGPITAPPKTNAPALGDISFMGDPLTDPKYSDTSKAAFYSEFKALHGAHASDPAVNFLALKTVAQNNGISMLGLIRIIDEEDTKKPGHTNIHAYETMIVDFLKTPKGHGYAHGTAKAGLPPTPAFSPTAGIDLTKLPSKEESDNLTYPILKEYETQDWWNKMVTASGAPITPGQASGIRAYTGNISSSINQFLYGDQTSISPTNYKHLKNAQLAMRPSIEPVMLHRGTGWSQLKMSGPAEAKAAIGQVRISEGFNSSSVGGSPGMGGQVILEIEAPPGTPMFWTNTPKISKNGTGVISQHPNEREMLLGAGIHYQILSVDDSSSYQTKVRVRVVRDPDLAHAAKSMSGNAEKTITAEEAVKRGKLVEQLLSSHRHLDTSATHAKKQPNGEIVWDAERDAIHRQIVDDLYKDAAGVPNDGKAVFLGGPIGAGKTTTLKDQAGVKLDDYLMVSPDDIKDVLAARGLIPEIPSHPEISPLERSTLVQQETLRIALMLAQRAAADKKNVIWDTTLGSTYSTRKRIQDLKDQGYSKISAIIVDAPPKVTAERSAARYLQGLNDYAQGIGHGGRYVPQAVLDDQYSGGKSWAQHTLKDLEHMFTSWRVYNNATAGKPAKLVKSSANS